MHVINFRMRDLRKLRQLYIEPGVFNTEATMLVLKRKSFPDHVERVFKFLDLQLKYADLSDDPYVFSKKLFTVTTLNTLSEYKNMEELVIPDTLVYVDGELSGFGLPIVKNHKNLGVIINSDKLPLAKKLPYLTQLGGIIEKVQKVEGNYNLHFGDLNEYNFILGEDDKVKAIDLDSSYLGIGEPLSMAYYLLKNQYIKSIPEKYKCTDKGIVIPSNNTDLYCYNMIVLNALAKEELYKQDINTYYEYMWYLETLDLPELLLEAFHNIYIPKNNINPKEALDEIDPSMEKRLNFNTFKKTLEKSKKYYT